jgi:hypothetical protein
MSFSSGPQQLVATFPNASSPAFQQAEGLALNIKFELCFWALGCPDKKSCKRLFPLVPALDSEIFDIDLLRFRRGISLDFPYQVGYRGAA